MSHFPPVFRQPHFYNSLDKARQESPLSADARLDPVPVWNGTRRVRIRVDDMREVDFLSTDITIPHERNWNPRGIESAKWIRRSVPNADKLNHKIWLIIGNIHTVYRAYPGISVSEAILLAKNATPEEMKEIDALHTASYTVPSRVEVMAAAHLQTLGESIKKLERKLKKLRRQR
jgi:hypothetical protein